MKLKRVFWLLAIFFLPTVPSRAQQPQKLARIGYLAIGTKDARPSEAFLAGMRELGYIDGKNIVIEYRGDPQRREDRLPEMARELVNLKVDVIVALDPPAARAAQLRYASHTDRHEEHGGPSQSGLGRQLGASGWQRHRRDFHLLGAIWQAIRVAQRGDLTALAGRRAAQSGSFGQRLQGDGQCGAGR